MSARPVGSTSAANPNVNQPQAENIQVRPAFRTWPFMGCKMFCRINLDQFVKGCPQPQDIDRIKRCAAAWRTCVEDCERYSRWSDMN